MGETVRHGTRDVARRGVPRLAPGAFSKRAAGPGGRVASSRRRPAEPGRVSCGHATIRHPRTHGRAGRSGRTSLRPAARRRSLVSHVATRRTARAGRPRGRGDGTRPASPRLARPRGRRGLRRPRLRAASRCGHVRACATQCRRARSRYRPAARQHGRRHARDPWLHLHPTGVTRKGLPVPSSRRRRPAQPGWRSADVSERAEAPEGRSERPSETARATPAPRETPPDLPNPVPVAGIMKHPMEPHA